MPQSLQVPWIPAWGSESLSLKSAPFRRDCEAVGKAGIKSQTAFAGVGGTPASTDFSCVALEKLVHLSESDFSTTGMLFTAHQLLPKEVIVYNWLTVWYMVDAQKCYFLLPSPSLSLIIYYMAT